MSRIYTLIYVLLLGCLSSSFCRADDTSAPLCDDQASDSGDSLVNGSTSGRLYLHTVYPPECSPGQKCDGKAYVVPGDIVSVRTTCGAWSYIEFTNKDLQLSAGWVEASGVTILDPIPAEELQKRQNLAEQTVERIETKSSHQANRNVCSQVADYANRGVLDRFKVKAGKWISTEELTPIFGNTLMDYTIYMWEYWNIDLNGDGITERIIMNTEGTGHFGVSLVLSHASGSKVQEFPGDGPDLSFIQIGKDYYFISGQGEFPKEMYKYSKNGEFESVCKFQQGDQPELRLILGQRNTVCSDVKDKGVKFIDQLDQHTIVVNPGDNRLGDATEVSGNDLASVDLDNDGNVDSVISLALDTPGGRGCYTEQLAVTDNNRLTIPKNKLNEILLKSLGDRLMCGTKMRAFVDAGTTYIDIQLDDGDRSVYLLRDNKINTVCKFRGQFVTRESN